MNIRQTLAQIANELDSIGMYDDANSLDSVLRELPNDIEQRVSPEDVLQMPDAKQIIKDARDWVEDCQWDDQESIGSYGDFQILRGVDRHYDGGLSQFLKDRRPV